jgi:glycosyltransferase involved in cell wall biosynthesis
MAKTRRSFTSSTINVAPAMDAGFREKHILFVTNPARYTYGGEMSLLPVVRRLDPGWRPHFLVEGPGPLDSLLRGEGFPVYRLALEIGSARPWRIRRLLCLLRLVNLLYRRRIQLVHVNLHFHAAFVSAACVAAGIPVVVHVRNMITQPVVTSFRKYDGIICISQAVRDSLVAQGQVPLGEVAGRLWIIPDGRDLSPFRAGNRSRVRREFGFDPMTPVVGMAARITRMKGQDTFLQIAALVKKRFPAARFLLVGAALHNKDERYLLELRRLISDLGLEKDVILAGHRDDMPDILAAMDCFVHPSRRGAFVSVLIEAMATGLPIVASDVDGIPECVGRDGAAVLLPPDDPCAWADAVARILEDGSLARTMAERGRERARRLFDIGPLSRRTAEVLEAVYQASQPAGLATPSAKGRCQAP